MKTQKWTAICAAIATLCAGALATQTPAASGTPLPSIPVAQLSPPSYAEALASPDWVSIPSGLAFKSCIHEVPDGSLVSENGTVTLNNAVLEVLPTCPYSDIVVDPALTTTTLQAQDSSTVESKGDTSAKAPPLSISIGEETTTPSGWFVASWWLASVQVTKLSAQWTVPTNPTTNCGLVYLFPSIEPDNSGGGIIQPVLQWGSNGTFGGNNWVIADWYVPRQVPQPTRLHRRLLQGMSLLARCPEPVLPHHHGPYRSRIKLQERENRWMLVRVLPPGRLCRVVCLKLIASPHARDSLR